MSVPTNDPARLELIGFKEATPHLESSAKTFLFACIDTLDAWPDRIETRSRHFGLFICLDARPITTDRLQRFARQLVEQGAGFVCAWGPDCERVHDAFDAASPYAPGDDGVLMTTWHEKDTLEDALHFLVWAAEPDGRFARACDTWIAVSVADRLAAETIPGTIRRLIGPKEQR